jgi:hypothetical protein
MKSCIDWGELELAIKNIPNATIEHAGLIVSLDHAQKSAAPTRDRRAH